MGEKWPCSCGTPNNFSSFHASWNLFFKYFRLRLWKFTTDMPFDRLTHSFPKMEPCLQLILWFIYPSLVLCSTITSVYNNPSYLAKITPGVPAGYHVATPCTHPDSLKMCWTILILKRERWVRGRVWEKFEQSKTIFMVEIHAGYWHVVLVPGPGQLPKFLLCYWMIVRYERTCNFRIR